MKKVSKLFSHDGFTLIELLIVMIIIGILSSIAVIGLKGATKTSKVASCRAEVSSVNSSALAYQYDSQNRSVSNLGGNISSSSLSGGVYTLVIDSITPATTYLQPGMILTRTSGIGVLGTGAVIRSVDSSTQITAVSQTPNTLGSLTLFSASQNPYNNFSGNISSSSLTGGVYTLVINNIVIDNITPAATYLQPGMILTRTSGIGVLGTGAVIRSVDSSTQITAVSQTSNTLGSLTSFSASYNPTRRDGANPLYPGYSQPLSVNKYFQVLLRWNSLALQSASTQPGSGDINFYFRPNTILDSSIWGPGNSISVYSNTASSLNVVNSPITALFATAPTPYLTVGSSLPQNVSGSGGIVVSSVPTVEVVDLLSGSTFTDQNVPESSCSNLG